MKMYFPSENNANIMKRSKFSAFKKLIAHNRYIIIFVAVCVVLCAVPILALLLSFLFAPTYSTQTTVTQVGYGGVTVEYAGKYGKEKTTFLDVETPTEYQIGDIVTIKIKGNEDIFGSVEIDEGS